MSNEIKKASGSVYQIMLYKQHALYKLQVYIVQLSWFLSHFSNFKSDTSFVTSTGNIYQDHNACLQEVEIRSDFFV
jgi:hypothetical protein